MNMNEQLKNAVLSELSFDPAVTATDVGVSVRDGIVCLTGWVDSHAAKVAAERAALRVKGVQSIASDMQVRLRPAFERSDMDIALAASRVLAWNCMLPPEQVHATVEGGWVTLSGVLPWDYQRRAAERAVQQLMGVRGVTNGIQVKPLVAAEAVQALIRAALARQATQDARAIDVAVDGPAVTLRGTVRSHAERRAAQEAAWSAPGVASVANQLMVDA